MRTERGPGFGRLIATGLTMVTLGVGASKPPVTYEPWDRMYRANRVLARHSECDVKVAPTSDSEVDLYTRPLGFVGQPLVLETISIDDAPGVVIHSYVDSNNRTQIRKSLISLSSNSYTIEQGIRYPNYVAYYFGHTDETILFHPNPTHAIKPEECDGVVQEYFEARPEKLVVNADRVEVDIVNKDRRKIFPLFQVSDVTRKRISDAYCLNNTTHRIDLSRSNFSGRVDNVTGELSTNVNCAFYPGVRS